jgi:hypothetical protein
MGMFFFYFFTAIYFQEERVFEKNLVLKSGLKNAFLKRISSSEKEIIWIKIDLLGKHVNLDLQIFIEFIYSFFSKCFNFLIQCLDKF